MRNGLPQQLHFINAVKFECDIILRLQCQINVSGLGIDLRNQFVDLMFTDYTVAPDGVREAFGHRGRAPDGF